MPNLLETTIPEDKQEEIKEFASVLFSLPREDRAVILSNANVLRVRADIEKARDADSKRKSGTE